MSQTKAQLISDLVQALNFTGTSSAPANGLFLSASNTLQLSTASTPRLTVNSDGHVDVIGNLDVGAGLDVTGAITGTAGLTIEGATVFNEAGADVDFRVEGDTDTHLLVADASTDKVAIGLNPSSQTPAGKFHVKLSTDKHIVFNDGQGEVGSVPCIIPINDSSSVTDLGFRANHLNFAAGTGAQSVAQKMTIDDTGVAIGTGNIDAAAFLHIKCGTDKNIHYSGGIGEIGNVSGFQTVNDAANSLVGFGIRASEMNFAIGSSTVLRLHTDGKVGIGTSTPTGIHNLAKVLEISGGDGGDLIIGNNVSGNIGAGAHIGAIAFKNIDNSIASTPHYAGIRCEATDTSGNMDLRFYTGITNLETDTPQMYIDSVGRLSIQGPATRAHLEVRSSGGSNTMLTALFGANEGVTTGALTDNTDKGCRIGIQHYDTDALPFAWISAASGNTANSINMGGGTSLMNAATAVGIYTASDTTTATGTKRFIVEADGTLHKYWDGTTIQASFGGSGQVNGITAVPSMVGTPFVVGRDTGTTRSAHFGGHLKFTGGYGIDFSDTADAANNANVAEILDDYEEGRHIVTITGGSSDPTVNLTQANLWYVKVGSLVTLSGELRWTTSVHGSGALRISLPFAASNLGTGHSWQGTAQTWNIDWTHDQSGTKYIVSEVGGNSSYMFIRCAESDSLNENSLKLGSNVIGSANSGYGVELCISISYRAD